MLEMGYIERRHSQTNVQQRLPNFASISDDMQRSAAITDLACVDCRTAQLIYSMWTARFGWFKWLYVWLCRLDLWCFYVLITVPHWACSLVLLHVCTLILILILYTIVHHGPPLKTAWRSVCRLRLPWKLHSVQVNKLHIHSKKLYVKVACAYYIVFVYKLL